MSVCLVALLAAAPSFAQPLRTSVFLEGGGPGLFYGLGAEVELMRTPNLDLRARVGASAFPVLFASGTVGTLSGQIAAVARPRGGRFGIESSIGVTTIGTRRFMFLGSLPLDTLVAVPIVGLALRVEPGSGQRIGGRAGVTAILHRDRWDAVFLPTLGATWSLTPPLSQSSIQ